MIDNIIINFNFKSGHLDKWCFIYNHSTKSASLQTMGSNTLPQFCTYLQVQTVFSKDNCTASPFYMLLYNVTLDSVIKWQV